MRVLFVAGNERGAEERQARAWLAREHGSELRSNAIAADAIADQALDEIDVVWIHAGSAAPGLSAAALAHLATYHQRGGGVLLTLLATPLALSLGVETVPPTIRTPAPWSRSTDDLWPDAFREWPDFPHIRGIQGWGDHPLFRGLLRGTFTWRATEGETVAEACYGGKGWPTANVIGVERAYVQLNTRKAVAWEYDAREGRVLCIGAHLCFAARDGSLHAQRDAVLRNALHRVRRPSAQSPLAARAAARAARSGQTPRISWPLGNFSPRVRHADETPQGQHLGPYHEASAVLGLSGAPSDQTPFTLAGNESLICGVEGSGIDEIWMRSLCVVSGGMRLTSRGEPGIATAVRVAPEAITRRMVFGDSTVIEQILPAQDRNLVMVEYRLADPDAPPPGGVAISFALPFRLQWPMPPDLLLPLKSQCVADEQATVVEVRGCDGEHTVTINVEGDAEVSLEPSEHAPRITVSSKLVVPVRVTFVASTPGSPSCVDTLTSAATVGAHAIVSARQEAFAMIREHRLRIDTPEPDLDVAVEWAKARLAMFAQDCGMMAGFASSRPGWGRSRPGYAWYFGRDACWSGDALLAAGMFEEVRHALRFLARSQDVTGKIAHEVTTSGVAHYDAADATPLFIRFVAAWAEWTGDLAFVRELWRAVGAAVAFVVATDRDGSGLPHNTGVGHGWIESGPLGGGAVTSYTAAIWIDALARLVPVAERIGDLSLAARARQWLMRARRGFESTLRDPMTGRIALHRMIDGTFIPDLTALSAVPIFLGADADPSVDATLEALAEPRYSALWGVRLIANDDPRYLPRGYHSGAVWPLYTGWLSLAEFARWRPDAAAGHLLANARLCVQRANGAFDEVLDGDTGEGAGICSDQAWSAAMVIAPFVTGMLGARADAFETRLRLTPRWPSAWLQASIRNLRVGACELDVAMTRAPAGIGASMTEYACVVRHGPLRLQLEHETSAGHRLRALVGGREMAPLTIREDGGRTVAGVDVVVHDALTIRFESNVPLGGRRSRAKGR